MSGISGRKSLKSARNMIRMVGNACFFRKETGKQTNEKEETDK